jgi:putative NADH-flavin reductase
MTRVLVIGASRGIGLETVKQLLSQGFAVRAMARSADRISIRDPQLEIVQGDALDADDLAEALAGVDAVIQAIGVRAGPDMVLKPVTLFSSATRILLPAMEKAGVSRLITVTGFGAGDSRAKIGCLQRIPFRLVLGRAYDDKDIQEKLIRDSDLDWTIVRPGVLTGRPGTGRYSVLEKPGQWRNGLIARADVADFLARQVEDRAYIHKTPVLVGLPL